MTTTAAKQSSGKGFMLAIVGIVVVGIGAVALLASGRESAITGDPSAPITIEGGGLDAMPGSVQVTDATTDPSVGKVAPTLIGTDFDGNEITIAPDGRPKAVYFLAHWCSHCQVEVPLLQELIDEGRVPEGFDIYGVSTSVTPERGNYPPQVWLSRENFQPPTMRDSEANEALLAYGAGGFPYVVYLDGENKVISRSAGELGKEQIASLWTLTAATAAIADAG